MTVKRTIILLMRLDAHIDRLYKELNETAKRYYVNGRNDGIKEFAERLKESLEGKTDPVDEYDIDVLAKEMTGGRNEHH